MRVITVVTRLNIGGASPPVIALAAGMRARGHQSLLVVGTPEPREGTMESEAEAAGAEIHRVPPLRRNPAPVDDCRAVRELWRLFRRFRPDVVATHMSKAGALGRVAARAAGVPVIVHTYHGKGFGVFNSAWRTGAALNAERVLARVATGSIVVSEKQREEFEALGVGRGRLRVIRYGLDLEPFLEPGDRGLLRRELRLPASSRLVGVVGRLVGIKGQDIFLQAAASLVDLYPDVHFILVGDGEKRAEYESLAARLGLSGRVHFLGWRRDVAAVLHSLELVCLPTVNDFEGTPLAVIEALAAGRPVVATDIGGVSEVVRHQVTGTLVPSRDVPALADGIRRVLADQAASSRMGAAGRALVAGAYRKDRMVDETEAYFAELVSRFARGGRAAEVSR